MLQLEPASPSASTSDASSAKSASTARDSLAGQPPRRTSLLRKAAKEFVTTPPAVIAASFMANLLALALPLTLLQIYDRILPNAAINTLAALLIGLMTVVVFDIALKILRDSLTTHAAAEKAFQGRVRAFATLLHADPADIRERPGRFWHDRMMAVEEVASVKENADKALFIDLPFVFIFLGMAALIGGWLVAVPIVMIVVLTLVMFRITAKQRELTEERREDDEKRFAQIAEWLGGIGTIKLLAMETQIYRRFEAMLTRGVAYSYHAVLQNNRVPVVGQLFSNLMMVAVSTAGAVQVIEGTMSIGTLACCSLLATRVAQPVFRVVSIAASLPNSALVEARAQTIYNLPVKLSVEPTQPIRGSILLADVTVAPRPGWSGFRSLNMLIEPGEMLGIAGAAGSGKTAFFSLIDGSLSPDSGHVQISGRDASSPEMRSLRRAIQRVDGRVTIFRGTILENVAMFRTGIYIAEAVAAMEAIGLDAQINKLPEGYDTRIGDGALLVLPYGFQQALMIARALAQRPSILLVSQIGALLDVDNFRRLERALRLLPERPTTILASQRAGVMAGASRVYEVRDGRLHLLGDVSAGGPATEPVNRDGRPLLPREPDVKHA
jgi:ATP-binding cassette, subfamily C, bacterial LapB